MAILLLNVPEMAVGILTIACGAVAAPWNPAYDDSEFEFHVLDQDAGALVVQAEMASLAVREWSSASC